MRVSILIPCYNAERWIGQAIESALAQSWQDKEVIVVDDGSTDRSLEVIKGYADRVHFETGPNRGGNNARNRLLALASGEWLQYLDAEDYLLESKIEEQVKFLAVNPATDVVFGPVTLEHWSESSVTRELLPIPQPHDLWILLARWYLPQTGALLFRKQAIESVGGWAPAQRSFSRAGAPAMPTEDDLDPIDAHRPIRARPFRPRRNRGRTLYRIAPSRCAPAISGCPRHRPRIWR